MPPQIQHQHGDNGYYYDRLPPMSDFPDYCHPCGDGGDDRSRQRALLPTGGGGGSSRAGLSASASASGRFPRPPPQKPMARGAGGRSDSDGSRGNVGMLLGGHINKPKLETVPPAMRRVKSSGDGGNVSSRSPISDGGSGRRASTGAVPSTVQGQGSDGCRGGRSALRHSRRPAPPPPPRQSLGAPKAKSNANTNGRARSRSADCRAATPKRAPPPPPPPPSRSFSARGDVGGTACQLSSPPPSPINGHDSFHSTSTVRTKNTCSKGPSTKEAEAEAAAGADAGANVRSSSLRRVGSSIRSKGSFSSVMIIREAASDVHSSSLPCSSSSVRIKNSSSNASGTRKTAAADRNARSSLRPRGSSSVMARTPSSNSMDSRGPSAGDAAEANASSSSSSLASSSVRVRKSFSNAVETRETAVAVAEANGRSPSLSPYSNSSSGKAEGGTRSSSSPLSNCAIRTKSSSVKSIDTQDVAYQDRSSSMPLEAHKNVPSTHSGRTARSTDRPPHSEIMMRASRICNEVYNYLDELDARDQWIPANKDKLNEYSTLSERLENRTSHSLAGKPSLYSKTSEEISQPCKSPGSSGSNPSLRKVIASNTWSSSGRSSTPIPSHFDRKTYCSKGLDTLSCSSLARQSPLNCSTHTHVSRNDTFENDQAHPRDHERIKSSFRSPRAGRGAAAYNTPPGDKSRGRSKSRDPLSSSMSNIHRRLSSAARRRASSSSRDRGCQSVDQMERTNRKSTDPTNRRSSNGEGSLASGLKRLSSSVDREKALTSSGTRSTASLSTEQSDLSVLSVVRSFPQRCTASTSRGKTRSSSLSRRARRALDALDSTGSSSSQLNGGRGSGKSKNDPQSPLPLERDDSKAAMVYDVPFDPLTGRCNYHPTICMAVREEERAGGGNDARKKKGSGSSNPPSDVIGDWRIVRKTCPKCMYNY